MGIAAVLLLVFSLLIALSNLKNRFTLLFSLQLVLTGVMTGLCLILMSKLANYNSSVYIDLLLYLKMSYIKLPVSAIVRFYNVASALCLACCLLQSVSLRIGGLWKRLLLPVPSLLYLVINDPGLRAAVFLDFYAAAPQTYFALNQLLYASTAAICLVCYLAPILTIIRRYLKTRFIINKLWMRALLVCVITTNLFTLCMFVFGIYSFIYRISTASIPKVANWNTTIYFPLLFLITLMVFLVLHYRYKPLPYTMIKFSNKFSMKDANAIRMLLHTYKNTFFLTERLAGTIAKNLAENPEKAAENAAMIESVSTESSEGIAKILNSLKTNFQYEMQPLNLADCVRGALAKSSLAEEIAVTQHFEREDIVVYANRDVLTEALVNVINNAGDAVEENEGEKRIEVGLCVENALVCIEIADNGSGLRKKEIKKIFSPFYSTKQGGKNNGIGLTYASNVIAQHSGKIYVKSTPHRRTVFQIILPLVKRSAQEVPLDKMTVDSGIARML